MSRIKIQNAHAMIKYHVQTIALLLRSIYKDGNSFMCLGGINLVCNFFKVKSILSKIVPCVVVIV